MALSTQTVAWCALATYGKPVVKRVMLPAGKGK